MRFYTNQPQLDCGIDWHARRLDVCLVHPAGESMLHRHMQAAPDLWLKAITPYRAGLVVAVACLFPWSWRADLCAAAGLPGVLGHALSMQAMPGGQATHDQRASQKMAARLRGGMLPQASVSPAARRATRAL